MISWMHVCCAVVWSHDVLRSKAAVWEGLFLWFQAFSATRSSSTLMVRSLVLCWSRYSPMTWDFSLCNTLRQQNIYNPVMNSMLRSHRPVALHEERVKRATDVSRKLANFEYGPVGKTHTQLTFCFSFFHIKKVQLCVKYHSDPKYKYHLYINT